MINIEIKLWQWEEKGEEKTCFSDVWENAVPFWRASPCTPIALLLFKTFCVCLSDTFMSLFPSWISGFFLLYVGIYLTYKEKIIGLLPGMLMTWWSFEIQHLKCHTLYLVLTTFAISFCYLMISFCWNMFCNYNKRFNVVLNSAKVWLDFLFWPKSFLCASIFSI